MITIAIATHKGGTGKTVTAMALAAAFARAGSSTLLVDLDPQGHSTLGLGVDVGDDQPTLRELLIENRARPLVEIVTATKTPNLSMVPASIVAERNAQLLYMRPKREEVLRRALLKLYPSPAVVVIDCPPSLGPLTENGIAAADWIVVPCQMEARAYDGLVDLLELVAAVKGDEFDAWRILYTKYDARRSVMNRAVQAQLERYSLRVLETTIPQSEPLNQAQLAREDIFTYADDSKGAQAYRALAGELLQLLDLPAAAGVGARS